jgi:hypothetical protein
MLWEFEVESKCGCLKILLNKKIVRPTCQSQAPLKRRPSRARDSYAAAAATSRRRCRPPTTSAPRVTHAAAAPCVTLLQCQSMGEAVSPLPATAAERNPLRSALATLLCSHIAALLYSKRRSANHPAPLSCASAPRQAGC